MIIAPVGNNEDYKSNKSLFDTSGHEKALH